ncbi:MBL fold metallo-hydrolase [Sharpea azabuensis]|uniref:MBL fold metallo-hydrolase n=1 Tax=Sharpea azabuensis TaxID=322505 RepID=UPI0023F4B5EF|nr:MBL fold metallo-hydrolase [Sharpea azabuensis]
MELTMLGTGNALVTECYNTCYVFEENDKYFLVDGGGGNEILKRLKYNNIDYRKIHDIMITHKHIDHLLGIIWVMRLILQKMLSGEYEGEAYIYGHDEVIALLRDLANKLLTTKQTSLIDERLHLVIVMNDEKQIIIGHEVTFFDIHSTKAKQFGYMMKLDEGYLVCCGDEPLNELNAHYVRNGNGSYMKPSVFTKTKKSISPMRNIIQQLKMRL